MGSMRRISASAAAGFMSWGVNYIYISNRPLSTLKEGAGAYNILSIVIFDLLDIGVDQWFFVPTLNAEFFLACKSCGGQEDVFYHGDNAVVFDNFGDCF